MYAYGYGYGYKFGRTKGRARAWTPAYLFAGGENGFWSGGYDPAGGRLWQDSSGTTAATTFGQPIGRVASLAPSGLYATQSTSLARPTLARWPKGGRRNLLRYTEDFSNSVWAKNNLDVSTEVDATFGLVQKITASGTGEVRHYVIQRYSTTPIGQSLRYCAVKAVTGRYIAIAAGSGPSESLVFDTQTGEYTAGYTGTDPSTQSSGRLSVLDLGDDWWGIGVFRDSVYDVALSIVNGPTATTDDFTFEADGESFLVAELQATADGLLERVPYQKVTSPYDISEEGVESLWHLYDDGGDSLPVVLPVGNYGVAYVDHLGQVTFDTLTSDGVTAIDTLLVERQLDVIIRDGDFSDTEKAFIETYWHRKYAA